MQIMVRDAYAFGDDGEEEYDGPSKSEVKRQLLALQDLGKHLTAMPQETLSNLSLPDDVLREVQEFQRIKTFKAKQRQIQHIGKLLRQADADAIRKAIADVKGQSAGMVALQHRCEKLRDELIASDEPLTAFVSSHPDVDLQSLRQTIRMARREAAKEDPAKRNPKFQRELFRVLREALLPEFQSSPEKTGDTAGEDEA